MTYTIITMDGCSFCDKAKKFLTDNGEKWEEFKLDTKEKVDTFKALGFKTVPQIFMDGVRIGGYNDLVNTY